VERWVRRFLRKGRPTDTGMLLMTLTYAFKESFTYERRSEPGTRPPALTLKLGRGSCRDLALLMIEGLRALGLAARFVSGYLYVPARDGARYRGGGSTHAWVQVYLPGAGWVEFDPTNAIVGNRDLIRVAVARDPAQAVPLSGSYFGDAGDFLDMAVEVSVRSAAAPVEDAGLAARA
jgi:transglutaminase-like putative cysteine protease